MHAIPGICGYNLIITVYYGQMNISVDILYFVGMTVRQFSNLEISDRKFTRPIHTLAGVVISLST